MDLDFNVDDAYIYLYNGPSIKWNVKKMSDRQESEENRDNKISKERIMSIESYNNEGRIRIVNLESQSSFV